MKHILRRLHMASALFFAKTVDKPCGICFNIENLKPLKRRLNSSCTHREPLTLGMGRDAELQMDR